MKTIHRDIVGAFIISADEKMLLGYNKKGGVYQGMLVIPGGGIEDGESELEALAREVSEETAINIAGADIQKIGESQGESEKFIKELGETALVKMTFYDYMIRLEEQSGDVVTSSDDDFEVAGWFPLSDLNELNLGPAVRRTLATKGLVDSQDLH